MRRLGNLIGKFDYLMRVFGKRVIISTLVMKPGGGETKIIINPPVRNIILYAPVVIFLFYVSILYIPSTRSIGLLLLEENNIVELLTFTVLTLGGILGLWLALTEKKNGKRLIVYGFYTIFSISLIVIALEEIAWGQWLFGFKTPETLKLINRQGETTLHNIGWLQGHSEIMRLTFGVGGLFGIRLFFHPTFREIGVPPVLLPWFIIIVIHAMIDVFNDIIPIQQQFDFFMQRTSELIELFIAISAFLYILLNFWLIESCTD